MKRIALVLAYLSCFVSALSLAQEETPDHDTMYKKHVAQIEKILANPDRVTTVLPAKDALGQADPSFAKYIEEFQKIYKAGYLGYAPNTDGGGVIWERLLTEKPELIERMRLTRWTTGRTPGSTINLAYMLPSFAQFDVYPVNGEELTNAFHKLNEHRLEATYDEPTGAYLLPTLELRRAVEVIAHGMITDKVNFLRVFHQLPDSLKKIYRTNEHGIDPNTRKEPYDLLASFLTFENLLPGTKADNIGFFRRSLFDLFEMDAAENPLIAAQWITHVQLDTKITKSLEIACSNGTTGSETRRFTPVVSGEESSEIIEVTYPSLIKSGTVWSITDRLREKGEVDISYTCQDRNFRVKLDTRKGDPLSVPDIHPFFTPERKVSRVLVPVSLVGEVGKYQALFGKAFLLARGFKLKSQERVIDTRVELEGAFKKFDSIMPVGHALDVNNLDFGAAQSREIVATKTLKVSATETREVEVHFWLPLKRNDWNKVILTRAEIAELLLGRHLSEKDSLFIFNASCDSASMLEAWTLAFRDALNLAVEQGALTRLGDAKDLPVVIGSERNFNTDNFAQIVNHFAYLELVFDDMLINKEPMEIFEDLKTKRTYKLIEKISDIIDWLKKQKQSGKNEGDEAIGAIDIPQQDIEALEQQVQNYQQQMQLYGWGDDEDSDESDGFKPVINLLREDLLNYNGMRIRMWDEAMPDEVREY